MHVNLLWQIHWKTGHTMLLKKNIVHFTHNLSALYLVNDPRVKDIWAPVHVTATIPMQISKPILVLIVHMVFLKKTHPHKPIFLCVYSPLYLDSNNHIIIQTTKLTAKSWSHPYMHTSSWSLGNLILLWVVVGRIGYSHQPDSNIMSSPICIIFREIGKGHPVMLLQIPYNFIGDGNQGKTHIYVTRLLFVLLWIYWNHREVLVYRFTWCLALS